MPTNQTDWFVALNTNWGQSLHFNVYFLSMPRCVKRNFSMNSVTSICVFCGLLNNHSSDLQTEEIPVDPSQSTFKYKKYFW